MKKILVAVTTLLALSVIFFGNSALAKEESPHSLSATLTFTTDYVFRGVSLTSENPAIQGSFDYAHASGFYAGIWGSNLSDTVGDSSIEIDYYIGFANTFSGIEYDLTVFLYSYPGADDEDNPAIGFEYDYFEFHLGLGYGLDLPMAPHIGINYDFSTEYFGEDGNSHHYSATVGVSLPYGFGLDGLYGYQEADGDGFSGGVSWDYAYWQVGLTKSFMGFDLDLRYIDTNSDGESLFGGIATERVVFSVSRSF